MARFRFDAFNTAAGEFTGGRTHIEAASQGEAASQFTEVLNGSYIPLNASDNPRPWRSTRCGRVVTCDAAHIHDVWLVTATK